MTEQPITFDESPRKDAALEWWFIQGYYEGERSGRRYFMATLFRHAPAKKSDCNRDGFTHLLSVLDPAKGRHEAVSLVDPAVVDLFVRAGTRRRGFNLASPVADLYFKEVAAHGVPRPICLERSPVVVKTSPLRAKWRDFSLRQTLHKFRLAFSEPATGRRCRFDLRPVRGGIQVDAFEIPFLENVAYRTYPRLELEGRVEGETVAGMAWLDHQWGDLGGWFFSRHSKDKLLGWDWFGINLENGADLLLMTHTDRESGQTLARYLVLREEDQPPFLYENVLAEPLRYWESRDTRIRYPVAWRIAIPEIGADIAFEPFVDNQEIPVFGPMRAIWEGAGTVSGTMDGKVVSGPARLELHGYGYIFDYQKQFDPLIQRVDDCIERFLPRSIGEAQLRKYVGPATWRHEASAHTQNLSNPFWDLVSRKGKRWRALFGFLMLESLGVPLEPYEMLFSAIPELCHTGALIIDDIEDDSEVRRGAACIHIRYGLDIALNAGNTLYFLPYLLLSDHPFLTREQRLEAYRLMVEGMVRSHFGQGLDIYWSKNLSVRNLERWRKGGLGPKILQMYAQKTATPIEGSAELASIIAGSEHAVREACLSFARVFGVAFQIVDDIHNFSDSPAWRKIAGEDLSSGKLTYVILRALELLKGKERRRLQTILCSKRLRRKPSGLQEGIDLVRKSGALRVCRREAKRMVEREWKRFSEKVPPSEPKTMLRILCANLLDIKTCS